MRSLRPSGNWWRKNGCGGRAHRKALMTVELKSNRLEMDEESLDELFYERGWTDGLPIVAPTPERVTQALRGTSRDPSDAIGAVPPKMGVATVEKIAVNAVMAGCLPQHLPVIIAAVEAMLAPEFNLGGCQATTHPVAPLIIVNGPVAAALAIGGGHNCFGQGPRANAVIGRAIRLVLLNIGGAIPGKLDHATHGSPAKYAYCVAENEARSPWEPLHVELGYDRSASTVTVVGAEAPHNINDHGSYTALGLLRTIAETMCQPGSNNAYMQHDGPWVVIGPEHAATIAGDGWSKQQVKDYLYQHSQIPIERYSRENIEQMLMSRWSPDVQAHARSWLQDATRTFRVPLCTRAADMHIVVAGGAGKHSLFIPTFGATVAVTRPVTR